MEKGCNEAHSPTWSNVFSQSAWKDSLLPSVGPDLHDRVIPRKDASKWHQQHSYPGCFGTPSLQWEEVKMRCLSKVLLSSVLEDQSFLKTCMSAAGSHHRHQFWQFWYTAKYREIYRLVINLSSITLDYLARAECIGHWLYMKNTLKNTWVKNQS